MVDTKVKVTRTHSTRGTAKKLLGDAMKVNKSTTIKRRKLKKLSMVEDENIKVVTIGEGDEKIDLDIVAATERMRKEVHDKGRTKSSHSKSRSPKGMKQNILQLRKRKSLRNLVPRREKLQKNNKAVVPKKEGRMKMRSLCLEGREMKFSKLRKY